MPGTHERDDHMPHELHIAHEKATQLAISLGYISHVDDDTLDTPGDLHQLLDYWTQIMDDCELNGKDASWEAAQAANGHMFYVEPAGLPAVSTYVLPQATMRDILVTALTDLVQESADKWSTPATTLA